MDEMNLMVVFGIWQGLLRMTGGTELDVHGFGELCGQRQRHSIWVGEESLLPPHNLHAIGHDLNFV